MSEQNQNTTVEESMEIVELDLTFKPEVFDPNKEQLRAIAAEVAKIEADPTKMTKDDLELINTTKNKLVKARTRIQKIGKAQREPATRYAKEVKAYEDELLAILAPEEDRMKTLEKSAKEHAMREERMKTLPEFKEKLASIGDTIEADDEFLLSLDPNQRDAYYVQRLTAKVEADAAAIKAQQEAEQVAAEAKQREEERAREDAKRALITARREIMLEIGFRPDMTGLILDTIDGTIGVSDNLIHTFTESEFATESTKWRRLSDAKKANDIKVAEERAKAQAEEEVKQRAAAEEAKRQAEEEAARKAQEEEAARIEQERKAQQAHEAYQKWLSDSSYNAETDVVKQENGVYVLYRKISTYTPQSVDSAS